jgi:hypothetical protein
MPAMFYAHLALTYFPLIIHCEEYKATQFSSAFCYVPTEAQTPPPPAPCSPTHINQYVPSSSTEEQASKLLSGKLLRQDCFKFLL